MPLALRRVTLAHPSSSSEGLIFILGPHFLCPGNSVSLGLATLMCLLFPGTSARRFPPFLSWL